MKESLIFAIAFLAGCAVALLLRAVLYRPHSAEPAPAPAPAAMGPGAPMAMPPSHP